MYYLMKEQMVLVPGVGWRPIGWKETETSPPLIPKGQSPTTWERERERLKRRSPVAADHTLEQ